MDCLENKNKAEPYQSSSTANSDVNKYRITLQVTNKVLTLEMVLDITLKCYDRDK